MENENWDQTGMALSAERVGALLEEPTEQALYLCYDVYGFDEGGQSVLHAEAGNTSRMQSGVECVRPRRWRVTSAGNWAVVYR